MFSNKKKYEVFEYKASNSVRFLYNTILGRIILKVISNKFIANIGRLYMDSFLSIPRMKKFIKKNNLKLDDYCDVNFNSFNKIFTRKYKNFDCKYTDDDFVCPASSKLLVKKISNDLTFEIKNSTYNLDSLFDDDIYEYFKGGYLMIFRLDVDDYHRYLFPDSGNLISSKFIKGKLHTVQPIVYDKFNVFHENSRCFSLLKTNHFGKVAFMEVGALMVGKINNHDVSYFTKGMEKGYFSFGGSTIVVCVKKDVLDIDSEILKNSENDLETIVNVGSVIGYKNKRL